MGMSEFLGSNPILHICNKEHGGDKEIVEEEERDTMMYEVWTGIIFIVQRFVDDESWTRRFVGWIKYGNRAFNGSGLTLIRKSQDKIRTKESKVSRTQYKAPTRRHLRL